MATEMEMETIPLYALRCWGRGHHGAVRVPRRGVYDGTGWICTGECSYDVCLMRRRWLRSWLFSWFGFLGASTIMGLLCLGGRRGGSVAELEWCRDVVSSR